MRYMRVSFLAYWLNSPPSAEIFYVDRELPELTPEIIAKLEDKFLTALKTHVGITTPLRLIYLGDSTVNLTLSQVHNIGWRIISEYDLEV